MSISAGCFRFLLGRRSLKKGEVSASTEVRRPLRRQGGSEIVGSSTLLCCGLYLTLWS